jgi:hypothetical protein
LTRLHAYFEVARDARDVLYIAGAKVERNCVRDYERRINLSFLNASQ